MDQGHAAELQEERRQQGWAVPVGRECSYWEPGQGKIAQGIIWKRQTGAQLGQIGIGLAR